MELALCDPEPLAVATWMLKSLTIVARPAAVAEPCTASSVVAINTPDLLPHFTSFVKGIADIIGQISARGIAQTQSGGYWEDAAGVDGWLPALPEGRIPARY